MPFLHWLLCLANSSSSDKTGSKVTSSVKPAAFLLYTFFLGLSSVPFAGTYKTCCSGSFVPPGPCGAPKVASLGSLNVWGPAWLDFQGPWEAEPSSQGPELPVNSQWAPQGWAADQTEGAQVSAHAHHLWPCLCLTPATPGSAQRHWSLLLASRLLC